MHPSLRALALASLVLGGCSNADFPVFLRDGNLHVPVPVRFSDLRILFPVSDCLARFTYFLLLRNGDLCFVNGFCRRFFTERSDVARLVLDVRHVHVD